MSITRRSLFRRVAAAAIAAVAAPAFIQAERLTYVPRVIASARAPQILAVGDSVTVGVSNHGPAGFRQLLRGRLYGLNAAIGEDLLMHGEAIYFTEADGIYDLEPDLKAHPFLWAQSALHPRPFERPQPTYGGVYLEKNGQQVVCKTGEEVMAALQDDQVVLAEVGAPDLHRLTPAQRHLRVVHDQLIARGEWPKIARSDDLT